MLVNKKKYIQIQYIIVVQKKSCSESCFVYSFVFQEISEKTRFYHQFTVHFYKKINVSIISTFLVTDSLFSIFFLLYKRKTAAKFSTNCWSVNKKKNFFFWFIFVFLSKLHAIIHHLSIKGALTYVFWTGLANSKY